METNNETIGSLPLAPENTPATIDFDKGPGYSPAEPDATHYVDDVVTPEEFFAEGTTPLAETKPETIIFDEAKFDADMKAAGRKAMEQALEFVKEHNPDVVLSDKGAAEAGIEPTPTVADPLGLATPAPDTIQTVIDGAINKFLIDPIVEQAAIDLGWAAAQAADEAIHESEALKIDGRPVATQKEIEAVVREVVDQTFISAPSSQEIVRLSEGDPDRAPYRVKNPTKGFVSSVGAASVFPDDKIYFIGDEQVSRATFYAQQAHVDSICYLAGEIEKLRQFNTKLLAALKSHGFDVNKLFR